MPLPLHIFEERYRVMIRRCSEEELPFGVLLHTGSTVQNVGCLAEIDDVMNEYGDGRFDVLTVGSDRFRVLAMHTAGPYLEADVEVFHDRVDEAAGLADFDALRTQAVDRLTEFARVAGYEVDPNFMNSLSAEELSFLLSTTDVFSTEERQQLIELRSTSERIRRASRALEAGRERRAMAQRIREVLGREDEDIDHLFN
jgi:Lon protease-like protein